MAEDAFTTLTEQMKPFLVHMFVKRKQTVYLDTLVLTPMVKMYHWTHAHAPIFTAQIWVEMDTTEELLMVLVEW